MTKYLLSVVGPTAIGKTALAIQLANYYKAEIISSDSRQFFKEMTIGTAVPNPEELNQAKHHFIQHISIKKTYSVGQFEKDAISKLEDIFEKNNVAIMVGGSGLYSNAVVYGLDDFPDVDASVRAKLNQRLKDEGIDSLQHELKDRDPKAYDTIAIDNPQRLIRALEICIGTGLPYSSFLNKRTTQRTFKTIAVGLNAERSIIYDRINKRVDIMVASGLLEEAKALYPYKNLNALNTVGCKELFNYFDGVWSLDFAISEIKKNTRRFAKRQLTWFRKDESILWFDYETPFETIVNTVNKTMAKKNPATKLDS